MNPFRIEKENSKFKSKNFYCNCDVENNYIKISYASIFEAGNSLFGDVENEEPNIAYSIILSILKVCIIFLYSSNFKRLSILAGKNWYKI